MWCAILFFGLPALGQSGLVVPCSDYHVTDADSSGLAAGLVAGSDQGGSAVDEGHQPKREAKDEGAGKDHRPLLTSFSGGFSTCADGITNLLQDCPQSQCLGLGSCCRSTGKCLLVYSDRDECELATVLLKAAEVADEVAARATSDIAAPEATRTLASSSKQAKSSSPPPAGGMSLGTSSHGCYCSKAAPQCRTDPNGQPACWGTLHCDEKPDSRCTASRTCSSLFRSHEAHLGSFCIQDPGEQTSFFFYCGGSKTLAVAPFTSPSAPPARFPLPDSSTEHPT